MASARHQVVVARSLLALLWASSCGNLCAAAGNVPTVDFEEAVNGVWSSKSTPKTTARVFVDNATFRKGSTVRGGFVYPRYDARLHHGDEVQFESIHSTWMHISSHPLYTMRGRTVALKASSGKYCAIAGSNEAALVTCDQDTPPFSAWFEVAGQGRNVSLKDLRGERFCVDGDEGVVCDERSESSRGAFEIVDLGNGNIAIMSGTRKKYCADTGDGLRCIFKKAEGAAIFELVLDQPLRPVVLLTSDRSEASTFVVDRLSNNGSIALMCKGLGRYVTVNKDTGALVCDSKHPQPIDSSRVSWWDVKTATFQSPETGLFFKAGALDAWDVEVKAANKESNGWSLWRVFLTGGYETLRPLIRGVNLGNWLLLERWMAHELYRDGSGALDFIGNCAPVDEHGLMKALEPSAAKKRLEQHWSSWITEDDIKWLSKHGVNAVRVPLGYWIVDPEPPFVSGQLKYLDDLFKWCEEHSLVVLLDFHGLKGSQTGNPTSGNCGGCGRDHCGKTTLDFLEEDEEKANLEVISKLVHRFGESPAFLGFEIANEVSSSADPQKTMQFYQKAYDIIRAASEDALIIIFATFNPSTYPFPNFNNVAEDVHLYFGMGFGSPTDDQQKNLEHASKAVQSLHWNVLVGEWSLGASGQRTSDWTQERRAKFFREFAKMQLQAWETHTIGWFYWSYKTSYANSTWNFRDMCEGGWLPGCIPEGQQYASALWWDEKDCAFAYLDGTCHEEASDGGNIGASVLLGLLVVLAVAAVVAICVLKPELVVAVQKSVVWVAGEVKARASAAAQKVKQSSSNGSTSSSSVAPAASAASAADKIPKAQPKAKKNAGSASPAVAPARKNRSNQEEKEGRRPLMTSSDQAIIP